MRVDVSEPGVLFARVLRGSKTVTTARFPVRAGNSAVAVRLPARRARYRLAVWVQDSARLESTWRYVKLAR